MFISPPRDGALAELPAKLKAHLPEIVDEMTAMVMRGVELFHDDEIIESGLRVSIEANISMLTHLMQNPSDLRKIEAPSDAVDWALRLAQRGLPFSAVLRTYNLCTARFFEFCVEELARFPTDPTSAIRAVGRLSSFIHSYVDHICEQISKFYDTERVRWIRQQDVVRAELVRAVLDGHVKNDVETQRALDYPLEGRHLAVVAWQSDAGRDDNQLIRLQSLISAFSKTLGCRRSPLLVPQDNLSVWGWVSLPLDCEHDPELTMKQLVASEPTMRVAMSDVREGISGFARAHRQAVIAQSVARHVEGEKSRVVSYGSTASLSFLCQDLDRTREWVADVLGELAGDHEQNAKLRESLEVFLNSGASYTTAAKRLNCHKNTVQYRVIRAEELRGRSYRENRLDLELALLACNWLGSAVFTTNPTETKRPKPI